MAAAGVSYVVSRESNSQYGETLNGVEPQDEPYTTRDCFTQCI